MEPNLFRNRWLALAFVGRVAVAAAALVGSEDDEGLLDTFMAGRGIEEPATPEDFAETIEPRSEELVPVAPEPEFDDEPVGAFSEDAELVDEADGFDTTPMVVHDGPDEEGAILEAEGEAVIVDPDAEGSEL